jgi:hypothetical protein
MASADRWSITASAVSKELLVESIARHRRWTVWHVPCLSIAKHCHKGAHIRNRMRRLRSLNIQAKYGNFDRETALQAVAALEKGEVMKKTLLALCAVATLAVSAVAVPAPAHAQRGVAAGVAAGLIGGAIVGGAIASQNGYYGPGYGYAPGPAYVADPGYGPPPGCYWQRQRFWDGYGWRVRSVRVCD